MQYAPGWTVGRKVSRLIGGELISVDLLPVDGLEDTWEGWWPQRPEQTQGRSVVAGICLYDNRWMVEFTRQGLNPEKNPPARRSLVIQKEREDAYKRLAAGQRLSQMQVPLFPGEYHKRLLTWQAAKLRLLKPSVVLFHLPVLEYHAYVAKLEELSGQAMPTAHQQVEEFTRLLMMLQSAVYGPELMSLIRYIRPLEMGAQKLEDSWSFPYLHPEAFGVDPETLLGLEDLAELRIALTVQQSTQRTVPVLSCVMGERHPYFENEVSAHSVVSLSF